MIIKRLTMHNFGVYASTNTFEFNGDKPIVLIGGLNGRGKTTFLEAVLLSLYGANSFAYQESRFPTYGQYLRAHVNTADGTKKTYVELEIELNNPEHDYFIIRRDWNALTKVKTSEIIHVSKNGEYSDFLTKNWPMFVENILPSALSNFFFFDGEKIAELAVDNTNAQLKESIRAMLGISVLDRLNVDLSKNIRKLQKVNNGSSSGAEIEALRNRRDVAESRLADIQRQIAEKETLLKQCEEKCEQKRQEYAVSGGDVANKRNALLTEKAKIEEKIRQNQEALVELAMGELPFSLVRDLLQKISEQGEKEHKASAKKNAEQYISVLANEYQQTNGTSQQISSFLDFVRTQTDSDPIKSIYNLTDQGLYHVTELSQGYVNKTMDHAQSILDEQKRLQVKLDEIENYLSIDIDEERLKEIFSEIHCLEQEIALHKADLVVLEQHRGSVNGEYIKAQAEFNRNITQLLEKMEADDDNRRDLKYSEMASRVLNEFAIRLQTKKVDILGETITSCYKKLANKKNLIDRITMDPVTLDLRYLNSEGIEVEKTILSAGEKQLMVISILWALALCSKKKLPVIIDTPLSRLDSNHRKSLIQIYFPQASEQTIILSTDSEITGEYYELMKKDIGDEFTLNYSDETKSTTIERGYFVGETGENE